MPAPAAMSPEEQLEDLRRRFTLLEGERKASYETAELSKQQNKDIINQLKEENKNLRVEITKLREEKPQTVEQQLERTMSEVQGLQRKFDSKKAANDKKREHLDNLTNKLAELSTGSKLCSSEASPEMRQIRVLENRLDKAMIKHNEAASIKKTYEAIVKRLKEERIGFDNQLQGIERTLKSKERDYEELLLLSHDAYHAKEMAQAELHRFEQGVMEERNQRDREVQEKKALVEQRVAMNKKLEEHQKKLKAQQEAERATALQQKEAAATKDLTMDPGSEQFQEERQKLEDYEEAFLAIKDATGVKDVNEVIQKFLTQEDTQKSLEKKEKDNHRTIELRSDELRKIRKQVEDLKFSQGGIANRRQAIDEFEKRLAEATEKFERNRGKYERLAKMLIDMQAGVGHLTEKLAPITIESEANLEMSEETIVDAIEQCGLKMDKLLRLVGVSKEDLNNKRAMLDDERYEEKLIIRSQADVRVKPADKDDDADDDDDDGFDEDEDVCGRNHVKYNSKQILEKQKTKNRRKGKAPAATA
mmetsp:Transcript_86827/g.250823  ORF Transcript_86827/g.250823 Transcript_86827/m.250823 type:complete len:533 (+) Transcript_86827:104-1702(+)